MINCIVFNAWWTQIACRQSYQIWFQLKTDTKKWLCRCMFTHFDDVCFIHFPGFLSRVHKDVKSRGAEMSRSGALYTYIIIITIIIILLLYKLNNLRVLYSAWRASNVEGCDCYEYKILKNMFFFILCFFACFKNSSLEDHTDFIPD